MKEQLPNKKFTLETIPREAVNRAYVCLDNIANDSISDEDLNWLIENLEPSAIKGLSSLREYLYEQDVLEKIIEKKRFPPGFFN